jgi:GNAT superfamily N-acetyltransferase
MSVTVEPVRNGKDLAQFLKLPYRIYGKNHPQYVYPLLGQMKAFLNKEKNPFFRHAETELWVARDGVIPVGRIAAAVDRNHNEHAGETIGFFGFYEATKDQEVADALLETARAWIAGQGMTAMRGPGCFTTNHEYLGLLIKGHERRPAIGMPWQPEYYLEQMESFGLAKLKDLYAWEFLAPGGAPPERMTRFVDRIRDRLDFTIRRFRMKQFWDEVDVVRWIYSEAWKDNWGFIPMDDEEFRHSAKDMKSMVDPGFLLIAEKDGQPIGFSMTTQDFNEVLYGLKGSLLPFGWLKFLLGKGKIRGARTLLMGVVPEFRAKGVDVMLVYETIRYGATKGIHRGECSWILEDNVAMNRILEKYGAEIKTVYRVLERAV